MCTAQACVHTSAIMPSSKAPQYSRNRKQGKLLPTLAMGAISTAMWITLSPLTCTSLHTTETHKRTNTQVFSTHLGNGRHLHCNVDHLQPRRDAAAALRQNGRRVGLPIVIGEHCLLPIAYRCDLVARERPARFEANTPDRVRSVQITPDHARSHQITPAPGCGSPAPRCCQQNRWGRASPGTPGPACGRPRGSVCVCVQCVVLLMMWV